MSALDTEASLALTFGLVVEVVLRTNSAISVITAKLANKAARLIALRLRAAESFKLKGATLLALVLLGKTVGRASLAADVEEVVLM